MVCNSHLVKQSFELLFLHIIIVFFDNIKYCDIFAQFYREFYIDNIWPSRAAFHIRKTNSVNYTHTYIHGLSLRNRNIKLIEWRSIHIRVIYRIFVTIICTINRFTENILRWHHIPIGKYVRADRFCITCGTICVFIAILYFNLNDIMTFDIIQLQVLIKIKETSDMVLRIIYWSIGICGSRSNLLNTTSNTTNQIFLSLIQRGKLVCINGTIIGSIFKWKRRKQIVYVINFVLYIR